MSDSDIHAFDPSHHAGKLARFLNQALPIIASERGLNERSRMKLRALANEMRLPKKQYENAILELQQGGHRGADALTRYEEGFVKLLIREFLDLKDGILSVRKESKAIELAESGFGISRIRARELVQRVATKHKIRRVSLSDSARYVENQIVQIIGSETQVSEELRKRFLETGEHWGIGPARIDGIIADATEFNRKSRRRIRTRRVIKLIAAALLIQLIAIGAIFSMQNWQRITNWLDHGLINNQPTESSVDPIENTNRRPAWWSDNITTNIRKLDFDDEEVASAFEQASSHQPADRNKGYLMFLNAAWLASDPDLDQPVETLLTDWYLTEPDDQAADGIANTLFSWSTVKQDELPNNARVFLRCMWANRMLIGIAERPSIGDRSDAIQDFLDRQFGHGSSQLPVADRVEQSRALLTESFWNLLLTQVDRQPDLVASFIPVLSGIPYSSEPADLTATKSAVLLALLSRNAQLWPSLKAEVLTILDYADQRHLNQWAEFCTATSDELVRNGLARPVATAIGLGDGGKTPSETISDIREYLNATAGGVNRNRLVCRELIVSQSRQWNIDLTLDAPPADDAQSIGRYVYLATLAMASGLQKADALENHNYYLSDSPADAEQNRTALLPDATRFGKTAGPARPTEVRAKDKAIEVLGDFAGNPPGSRKTAFERLTEVADRFPEISGEEVVVVVDYLLSDKLTPDEFLAIEQYVHRLRHWAHLFIGLADTVGSGTGRIDQSLMVARLLRGSEIDLTESRNWRRELKLILLQFVAEESREQARESSRDEWQQLREQITVANIVRHAVGGYSLDSTMDRSSPDWLTWHLAIELDDSAENDGDNVWAMINFVGKSELQRLVLAQQKLIDSSASRIGEQYPGLQPQLQRIVDRHEVQSSRSRTIDEQLSLGEWTLLRLWWIVR